MNMENTIERGRSVGNSRSSIKLILLFSDHRVSGLGVLSFGQSVQDRWLCWLTSRGLPDHSLVISWYMKHGWFIVCFLVKQMEPQSWHCLGLSSCWQCHTLFYPQCFWVPCPVSGIPSAGAHSEESLKAAGELYLA